MNAWRTAYLMVFKNGTQNVDQRVSGLRNDCSYKMGVVMMWR